MLSIKSMQLAVTKGLGKSSLVLGKHSPQILLGVGLIGMIASTILASRATLSLEKVLKEGEDDINRVKDAREEQDEKNYTPEEYTRDLTIVYANTGINLAKLYGPAVGVGVGSVACILGAHGILSKRNVGLAAAYNVVAQAFTGYRARVVETYGEAVDSNFSHGTRDEVITEVTMDGEGNKVKSKKTIKVSVDDIKKKEYLRYFDNSSAMYRGDANLDSYFLSAQQAYANQQLKAVGHVYLNDIFRALGYPDTPAGAVVGWVLDAPGCDGYIDFGIERIFNHPGTHAVLTFNVMGVMYDLV